LPASEAPLRRSDAPWPALVSFAGGILGPLPLMFGLSHTAAAAASLPLKDTALPSAGTSVAVGVIGFLGDGVSLALFTLGLHYLGTARTGAHFSLAHARTLSLRS
jgi:hypothetical protein